MSFYVESVALSSLAATSAVGDEAKDEPYK